MHTVIAKNDFNSEINIGSSEPYRNLVIKNEIPIKTNKNTMNKKVNGVHLEKYLKHRKPDKTATII